MCYMWVYMCVLFKNISQKTNIRSSIICILTFTLRKPSKIPGHLLFQDTIELSSTMFPFNPIVFIWRTKLSFVRAKYMLKITVTAFTIYECIDLQNLPVTKSQFLTILYFQIEHICFPEETLQHGP
jgi:hypothetical protein